MQKRAPPRLSKEAQEWDKRFPSPTKEKCGKKTTTPYVIPRCSECDGVVIEDRASGDLICQECGLCERLLIPDDVEYMDVDWTRISLTTKSQHVPAKYMLDLIRRFGIDERLVPELTLRYKAVKYWSERNKPAGRKSLPNYRKRYDVAPAGVTTLLLISTYLSLLIFVQLTHFIACSCN